MSVTLSSSSTLDRLFQRTNAAITIDLPFDFSHNRVKQIEVEGPDDEKERNAQYYAEEIRAKILLFNERGELHSKQPLKEHDIALIDSIHTFMEIFRELINGAEENLEIFNGTDLINNKPGDYDFLNTFLTNLERIDNRFANSSLDQLKEKLRIAIAEFVAYQCYHTHEYFSDCGSIRKCTKLYLIENYPEKCERYQLPCIYDDINEEKYQDVLKPYVEESKTYHDLANKVLQCYTALDNRYLFLLQ